MFEKPLGEVAGVFMDCLVTLVIVLHGLCTMNGKTTYENLVNLLCGLANSRSGSPIRFRMWTSRSPIHLSLTNPRHADRTRSEATCDAWRNCVCVCVRWSSHEKWDPQLFSLLLLCMYPGITRGDEGKKGTPPAMFWSHIYPSIWITQWKMRFLTLFICRYTDELLWITQCLSLLPGKGLDAKM